MFISFKDLISEKCVVIYFRKMLWFLNCMLSTRKHTSPYFKVFWPATSISVVLLHHYVTGKQKQNIELRVQGNPRKRATFLCNSVQTQMHIAIIRSLLLMESTNKLLSGTVEVGLRNQSARTSTTRRIVVCPFTANTSLTCSTVPSQRGTLEQLCVVQSKDSGVDTARIWLLFGGNGSVSTWIIYLLEMQYNSGLRAINRCHQKENLHLVLNFL